MATITVKQAGGGDHLTIAAALAAIGTTAGAGADDIVEVYNGTYEEGILNTLPSGTSWLHPFRLQVATSNTATIKNTGENNLRIYEPTSLAFYSIIRGFIFDGTNLTEGDQVSFSASDSAPSSIRVESCEFINTEWYSGVYIGAFASDIQIVDNEIHGGAFFGVGGLGRAHGIYITGSNCLIDGNLIYDVPCFGIHNYYNVGPSFPSNNTIQNNVIYDFAQNVHLAAGIIVTSGSNNICRLNLVYNGLGADGDGGVGIAVGGTGQQVYNNTCYGNSYQGIEAGSSTNAFIKNNIAYLNGTNLEFTGATALDQSNNFTSNPSFTNAGAGDFTLLAGSPAINYGVYVGLSFEGVAPDAGAFEFETPTAPTGPVHVGSSMIMGGRMGMR
jgi:parallel beta-helix repeat protein